MKCKHPKCKTTMSSGSPKLCPKHQEAERVLLVNGAFTRLSSELKRFRSVCSQAGSPIRAVSFRVGADAETKMHVTYQRK